MAHQSLLRLACPAEGVTLQASQQVVGAEYVVPLWVLGLIQTEAGEQALGNAPSCAAHSARHCSSSRVICQLGKQLLRWTHCRLTWLLPMMDMQ